MEAVITLFIGLAIPTIIFLLLLKIGGKKKETVDWPTARKSKF